MSLIHVQDLLKILEDSSPILLDASWYLPAAKRNAEAEYRAALFRARNFLILTPFVILSRFIRTCCPQRKYLLTPYRRSVFAATIM